MAMRFGHRICSHVRINNLPAFSTSLRGRSYWSGSISPVPGAAGVKASTLLGATSFAIWAGWFYRYDVFSLRTMVENLKAEKKAREMTKRLNRVKLLVEEENYQKLDRNKFKSEDDYLKMLLSAELNSEYAYLEMLEREANAMKEELFERELGLLDAKIYQREIAALKATFEKTRLAKESNTTQAA